MKRNGVPLILWAFSVGALAQAPPYVPPASPRSTLNFDLNWRFIREDVPGAEPSGYDNPAWPNLTAPPPFNDVYSVRPIISHGGGDRGNYSGLAGYRTPFKLPSKLAGNPVF